MYIILVITNREEPYSLLLNNHKDNYLKIRLQNRCQFDF